MPNLTVSLNDELFAFVKQHNEIRWSEIIRRSIEQFRKKLEILEKLDESEQLEVLDIILNDSQLTEKDSEDIGEKIKEGIVTLQKNKQRAK